MVGLPISMLSSVLVVMADMPDIPSHCLCDGHNANNYSKRGVECSGFAALDCMFSSYDQTFDDVVSTLQTLAQTPDVVDVTITNSKYSALDLGDAEYKEMGSLFGAFPSAQVKRISIIDNRVKGCTQSDVGIADFGAGLVNMAALESLHAHWYGNLGIGRLSCSNESSTDAAARTGLVGLGVALSKIATLRSLDLNLNYPNGAYRICSGDVAAFAEVALSQMSGLEDIGLNLNNQPIDDTALSVLGQAVAQLPLRGVNLQLKTIDEHYHEITGTQGAVDLFAGLGAAGATLESVAVSLHLSAAGDAKAVYDAMGSAFSKMPVLESLWLEFQDQDLQADRRGFKQGLGSARALKLLHADVPCIPCAGDAPWQCSDMGTFSDVFAGTCVECNTSPRSEECLCWEQNYERGCSYCDYGNRVDNKTWCTNWPMQQQELFL